MSKCNLVCYAALAFVLTGVSAFSQSECPIEITDADGSIANIVVAVFRNNSNKQVQAVKFTAQFFNAVDEPSGMEALTINPMKPFKPGMSLDVLGKVALFSRDPHSRFVLWIDRIKFTDETYWNDNGSHQCKRVSEQWISEKDRKKRRKESQ